MADFSFRLENLLHVRLAQRDSLRRHLAEAEEVEHALEKERRAVLSELDEIGRAARVGLRGSVDVDRLLEARRYALVLQARQLDFQKKLDAARAESQARLQAVVAADRDVKVLEKLRARCRDRWRREEERQEARRLDEVAIMQNIQGRNRDK